MEATKMANFSRTDLDFLLQQISISEDDSTAQSEGIFNALPGLGQGIGKINHLFHKF
jgi:hypothetical protein